MMLTDVRYKILRGYMGIEIYYAFKICTCNTLQNALINCKINTFIGLLRLGKQEVVF